MSGNAVVICAIAALGFAFDSYVLLMLPIIIRAIDAVKKLEAKKHAPTPVPVDIYGPTRPDLVGS